MLRVIASYIYVVVLSPLVVVFVVGVSLVYMHVQSNGHWEYFVKHLSSRLVSSLFLFLFARKFIRDATRNNNNSGKLDTEKITNSVAVTSRFLLTILRVPFISSLHLDIYIQLYFTPLFVFFFCCLFAVCRLENAHSVEMFVFSWLRFEWRFLGSECRFGVALFGVDKQCQEKWTTCPRLLTECLFSVARRFEWLVY